ncbi:hypothetical protein DL96DRAFT_1565610 [Flagelloscypha sp. PMI_526]|nr:hypothetical protein DL96DRAFT_1565610 [Flagelloscypha sp. PMI_526]
MLLAYPRLFFTTGNPYRYGFYDVETRNVLTWFSKPYQLPTFFYLDRNNSRAISLGTVSKYLHVYTLPEEGLEDISINSGRFPMAEAQGYQVFDSVFAGLDRKMPHGTFTARFSADIGSALTKFDVRGYLPPPSSRPKDSPRHVIRRMQVVPNPDSFYLEAPYCLEIVDTQTCPIMQWHSGDSQVLPGGRRWLWFIDNSAKNVRSGKGPYIFKDGKLVVKEFVPLPKPVVPEEDVDSDWDSSD